MPVKRKTAFDSPDSCNKCGKQNILILKDSIDYLTPCEYETECTVCGFKDYWAYGFFESRQDGLNRSDKY